MRKTITLIRGLPGSGKSTLAKKMVSSDHNAKHFETDSYFMVDGVYTFDPSKLTDNHAKCLSDATNAMRKGHNVIVSNTFTMRWEIVPYIECAMNLGFDVQIIHCQGHWTNIHGVPLDAMKRMRDRWEDIDISEFYPYYGTQES